MTEMIVHKSNRPVPSVIRCIDVNSGDLLWERGPGNSEVAFSGAVSMEFSAQYLYLLLRAIYPLSGDPENSRRWSVRVLDKLTGKLQYDHLGDELLAGLQVQLLVDPTTDRFRIDAPATSGINPRTVWRCDWQDDGSISKSTGGTHRVLGSLGDGTFYALTNNEVTYLENFDGTQTWNLSLLDLPAELVTPGDDETEMGFQFPGTDRGLLAQPVGRAAVYSLWPLVAAGTLVGRTQFRGQYRPLEDEFFDCTYAVAVIAGAADVAVALLGASQSWTYYTGVEIVPDSSVPSGEYEPDGDYVQGFGGNSYRLLDRRSVTGLSGSWSATINAIRYFQDDRGPEVSFVQYTPSNSVAVHVGATLIEEAPLDASWPNDGLARGIAPRTPTSLPAHHPYRPVLTPDYYQPTPAVGRTIIFAGRYRDVSQSAWGSDACAGMVLTGELTSPVVHAEDIGGAITSIGLTGRMFQGVPPLGYTTADLAAECTSVLGADVFFPVGLEARSSWHRHRGHGQLELGTFNLRGATRRDVIDDDGTLHPSFYEYRLAIGKLDQSEIYAYKTVTINGTVRTSLGTSWPIAIDAAGTCLHWIDNDFWLFRPAADEHYEPERLTLRQDLIDAAPGSLTIVQNGQALLAIPQRALQNEDVICWPVLIDSRPAFAVISKADFAVLRFLRYKRDISHEEANLEGHRLYLCSSSPNWPRD